MRGYSEGKTWVICEDDCKHLCCSKEVYAPRAPNIPRSQTSSPHYHSPSLPRRRSPSRRRHRHRVLGAGGAVGGQPVVRHGHWLPPDAGPSLCHRDHCGRTHCCGAPACALTSPNRFPGMDWRRSATGVPSPSTRSHPCPLPRTPSQTALRGGPEGYAACTCHGVERYTGDARHTTIHDCSRLILFCGKSDAARASSSSRPPTLHPSCFSSWRRPHQPTPSSLSSKGHRHQGHQGRGSALGSLGGQRSVRGVDGGGVGDERRERGGFGVHQQHQHHPHPRCGSPDSQSSRRPPSSPSPPPRDAPRSSDSPRSDSGLRYQEGSLGSNGQ